MARLRATFYFVVRGLLVDETLLGRTASVQRDGMQIELELPIRDQGVEEVAARPEDESIPPGLFRDEADFPLVDGGGRVTSGISVRPPEGCARIRRLRARVLYDGALSAADYEDPDRHPNTDSAFDELRAAGESAKAVVESFIANVRARRNQYWLGLHGSEAVHVGDVEVVDLDAQRQLPIYLHLSGMVISTGRRNTALAETGFDEVTAAVVAGESPTLAHELLLEAAYFHDEDLPTDRQRAVLSAAIACEVRVKEALRAAALNDRESRLAELLIASPRQYTLAVLDLFDRPMEILAGESLRKSDPGLFKQVTRLIEMRNAIAHRGEVPDSETTSEWVRAAFGAFRWLEGLSSATARS